MSSTTPPGSDPQSSDSESLDPISALLRQVEEPNGPVTPGTEPPRPPTNGSKKPKKIRKPKPRWMKITAIVIIAILLVPAVSLARAVVTPNNLSIPERGAEWMRDNNLGFILNTFENWWLSRHQPKTGGEPDRAIAAIDVENAGPTTTVKSIAPHLPKPANVQIPEGVTPVANEGVWLPVGPMVGGAQPMYTTQVRPDSIHTSILDGLTWMDPKLLKFELFPGTEEPGGKWAKPSQVPMDQRLTLVAAFNSGFRMQDARGGFYLDGQTKGTLRDGAASLVLYADGRATVGVWGRDVTLTPDVVGVRQNLDLIIDNGGGPPNPSGPITAAKPGAPVAGLSDNSDGAWGATFGNKILAWRSAVGVTADGALIYGYGDGLGALSLAQLMLRAGCVRAMELDINTVWTTFNFYATTRFLDPTSVQGTKLLPDSFKSANRYLSPDARDFVGVFTRTF
ncbi:MAG: hypothetical protein QNL69_05820 [Acidimicrobiales bacterium]